MKIISYILCYVILFVVFSCGSVRHNQRVEYERDQFETKWRKTQYKWLMCITEKTNLHVNTGVKIDSLQKAIWYRDGVIDSLKFQLKILNRKFTGPYKKGW